MWAGITLMMRRGFRSNVVARVSRELDSPSRLIACRLLYFWGYCLFQGRGIFPLVITLRCSVCGTQILRRSNHLGNPPKTNGHEL